MFYRRTPGIPGEQSVARLQSLEVNGSRQYLLIRGESRHKPILLFLHGGPGGAQSGLARRRIQSLEKDFVVVQWDQRAAGLSYSPAVPPESMTIAQFVQDGEVVVRWLLREFGQPKLFLVGHSWGTVLGTLLAARCPELFHAYVGMGQVASMADGERLSYQFTLDAARRWKVSRAIRDLERIGPPPYKDFKQIMTQRRWLRRFGGVVHRPVSGWQLLQSLLSSTEYTLADFVRLVRGNAFSLKRLWPELSGTDLTAQVPGLKVPVYFLLGRYDYNTPSELAAAYFERLAAPRKELVWFENSAHGLWIEEPQEFARVMRHVLADQTA